MRIGNRTYEISCAMSTGTSVRSFDDEIELTFSYTDDELGGRPASELRVEYWDEVLKAWIEVPSRVEPSTRRIVALTDHLTKFALMINPISPRMSDIAGHWAEKHVLKMMSLGIVNGYADATFKPDKTLTREQFAKMVVLASGLTPEANPQLTFADAESIAVWARGYVAAAVKAGIIKGLDGNRFGPSEPVTRAQVATMLMRALNSTPSTAGVQFSDNASIPSWAAASIQAASEKGIIGGFEDGTFRPSISTTRAQAAKMLSQFVTVKAAE